MLWMGVRALRPNGMAAEMALADAKDVGSMKSISRLNAMDSIAGCADFARAERLFY